MFSALLLFSGGFAVTYYNGRANNRQGAQKTKDALSRLDMGRDINFQSDISVRSDHPPGPYAEKLQDEKINISLETPVEEWPCLSEESRESCNEAYRFRKEANLSPSTKLTIKEGGARCVCPPENAMINSITNSPASEQKWHRNRQPESYLPAQVARCEFGEDIKSCKDAYKFRAEAGLDAAKPLIISSGNRRCSCPPENRELAFQNAEQKWQGRNRVDLTVLADYDKIKRNHYAPLFVRNLIITNQLNKDFYNRYF